MMRKIISYTEEITDKSHQHFVRNIGIDENKKEVIRMSLYLADKIDAKAIVVFTHTGFMGKTAADPFALNSPYTRLLFRMQQ